MKVYYDGEHVSHPASGREWLPGVNDASEEQALLGVRGGLKLRKATEGEVKYWESKQPPETPAVATAKPTKAEKAAEKAEEEADHAARKALGLGDPPEPEKAPKTTAVVAAKKE